MRNIINKLEKEIEKLFKRSPLPVESIIQRLSKAAKIADPIDFEIVKWLSSQDRIFDEVFAVPAIAMLPAWGEIGIDILLDHAFNGPHNTAALMVLSSISLGKKPTPKTVCLLNKNHEKYFDYRISNNLASETVKKIRATILEAISDPDKKSLIILSLGSLGILSHESNEYRGCFDFYINLFLDSHLVVNQTMLNEFETLLNSSPKKEEDLQKFLTTHPILLDPYMIELRSKHQLGDDFITDYIIRRSNNKYIVVEIENSTDKIFTKAGDFTSNLNKALAQVRDFQAWISENKAYAQKKLPGIDHPSGLVIIGRNKDIDDINMKRLSEENYSRRGYLKIVTYDNLLDQGIVVYKNLLNLPLVFRAKDQKTI